MLLSSTFRLHNQYGYMIVSVYVFPQPSTANHQMFCKFFWELCRASIGERFRFLFDFEASLNASEAQFFLHLLGQKLQLIERICIFNQSCVEWSKTIRESLVSNGNVTNRCVRDRCAHTLHISLFCERKRTFDIEYGAQQEFNVRGNRNKKPPVVVL